VVLTTHSPTTVALAPKGSTFVLENCRLEPIDNAAAVGRLTHGLPYLSIRHDSRIQVFVESEYDAKRFESVLGALQSSRLYEPAFDFSFTHFNKVKGKGGCADVLRLVPELRSAGADFVYGIVDSDGNKNEARDGVVVLGDHKRYSADNYFLDPVLLAAMSVLNSWSEPKHPGRNEMQLGNTGFLGGIEQLEATTVERVIQVVSSKVCPQSTATTQVSVAGTVDTFAMPNWWLETRGKDVFDKVAATFPALGKFDNNLENFARGVITDVVVREPGLLSKDVVDTFRSIEAAATAGS